ncbi:MAG: helix-turn-helix domain-containing protein, partial [Alicyclobacillus sp.]|nr:helix-turn-helix domain-containing protein [Alicyclobacillus sp.]
MSLGARIAALRKAKGWTQAVLAQQTELSPSTIAMYETNRRTPNAEALHKLAEALGVTESDLQLPEPATEPSVAAASESAAGLASDPPETSLTQTADSATPIASTDAVNSANDAVAATDPGKPRTQLMLTHEEAKIILFLRMNPSCRPFIESYIRSDARQREQLSKTWRLIQEFHPQG